MILRTDTIGHFEKPTEQNLKDAISYPNLTVRENDIVKLQVNDNCYIAVWIGSKEKGHRLVVRFDDRKVECASRIDSATAIELMKKYLNSDMSWFKSYSWDQPIVEKLLENIKRLTNS